FAVRAQAEVRAPIAGVVELGWYEGEYSRSGHPVKVRLNSLGDGMTDPAAGEVQHFQAYKLKNGVSLAGMVLSFHKLQPGDRLWPGQVLAQVRADDLHEQILRLQGRLDDLKNRNESGHEVLARLQFVKEQLARATLWAPEDGQPWLVLKVLAPHLVGGEAGAPLALIAPIDPVTPEPRDPVAILEIAEKHLGEVAVGQEVRLASAVFNQRLHGHAEGCIDRIEPLGEPGPNGQRVFRARALITRAPFPIRPGSSFKAEIIVGTKQVYRIILEQ